MADWSSTVSEYLRLDGFLPGLLVPVEAAPSLVGGLVLLSISLYTLTLKSQRILLRFALAPLAIYLFWDFGYGPYNTPTSQITVSMAVIGIYGIMRVVETTIVGLLDVDPPHWVVGGEKEPLPSSVKGRIAYALDLTTSVRGTSWFSHRHWDWAPTFLLNTQTSTLSRAEFIKKSLLSLLYQYFILDAVDTLNKSRHWDMSNAYPITSLRVPEQLLFSLSVCAGTALSITFPYTLIALTFVSLGCHPSGWPPTFDSPYWASSLVDFWSNRWHAIFRRVFSRLALGLMYISPIPTSTSPLARRCLRAVIIFALSASLHLMVMYRLDHDYRNPDHHPRTFLDPSILKFFLSQPAGLAFEVAIIQPLSMHLSEPWRVHFTRLWAWCFLLWSGRFWSDVWVRRGMWNDREKVVGWSVFRGVLWNQWKI